MKRTTATAKQLFQFLEHVLIAVDEANGDIFHSEPVDCARLVQKVPGFRVHKNIVSRAGSPAYRYIRTSVLCATWNFEETLKNS